MIDTEAFRAELERDGFSVSQVSWEPGTVNASHSHPFTARLLCLSGAITIETPDGVTTCRPGERIEVAANTPHSEKVGDQGARLMVGRKGN